MNKELIVDLGCGVKKRTKGGKLVSDISKATAAEMFKVIHARVPTGDELERQWRGLTMRDVIGIDLASRDTPQADIKCHLGYERIPIDDATVDYVLAHDFVEHLPFIDGEKRPLEHLFKEVYRILKVGGYFEIKVPSFPYAWCKFFQPLHRSYWGSEAVNIVRGKLELCASFREADNKQYILLLKYS